jgi:hypothetical protein
MRASCRVGMVLPFFVMCVLIFLSPGSVSCRRLETLGETSPNPGPESQGAAAEYAQWIASVRLKQQGRAQELEGEPAMVQPDLSLDFPGMKQYMDWESVMTPATYIVVDQSGLGNFTTVNDAVNSIPRDRYRQYRITIQVNAGVYRLISKTLIQLHKCFFFLVGL